MLNLVGEMSSEIGFEGSPMLGEVPLPHAGG